MLGPLLALCAALTFALNTVSARRGVMSGSASQATMVTVPLGALITLLAVTVTGLLPVLFDFDLRGYLLLSAAGILHFVFGRYCNYRAIQAIGAVLSGPVQEMSIVWTVGLALILLGETLNIQQFIGIALIVFAPTLGMRRSRIKPKEKPELGFSPRYAEGYTFAVLCALSYGTSPLLVAAALPAMGGVGAGIVSCMISYVAAAITVAVVVLPLPGQWNHIRAIAPGPLKWFCVSGTLVCISQLTRYMALAIAPVSVVTPIQRLATLFRLIFSRILNPNLEIFDSGIYLATFLSLFGVLLLTLEPGMLGSALHLPQAFIDLLTFDPLSAGV